MSVTVGLLPPRRGAVEVYGRPVTGRAPEVDRRPRRRAGAAGPPRLPQPHACARTWRWPGAGRATGARRRGRSSSVYGAFPRLRERQRQFAGSLSGGEQQMLAIAPRADVQSPRAADGRAVGGPGAADRRRGHGHDPAAEGAGAVDPAGRAERAGWCSRWPTTSSSSTAARWHSRERWATCTPRESTCASTSACIESHRASGIATSVCFSAGSWSR